MSTSRSRSRVSSTSRHMPGSRSVSYAQSALPDGPVDQETAELFSELVHPHHEQEETLVDDEQEDPLRERQKLPWWKRPSPWWLMMCTPLSTIAMSATLAPKIEIYTLLACSVHKPDIFKDRKSLPASLPLSLLPRAEYQAEITFPPSFDIALNNDTSPPTEEPKPSPCSSDPVVLAAVARLTAFITTTMGVLGCLTTGWWGAYSDRYGRTRILSLTIFGLLMNDFNFILVTKYFRSLPGDGYWFLIVGPIIEGFLGGFGTASAASHAYMADTTSAAERSRIFSIFLGVVFTGIGLGPSIGGLLIQATNNVLSVFYLAASIHGAYAILSFFILPESLTKNQMQAAFVQYREQQRVLDEQETTILTRIQRLFTFLKPLTIFFPEPIERANPMKGRKWDWNLTLIALAYGFTISIMGSLTYKFQYIIAVFGWTSAKVGYFLTISGGTRALYLAVILPFTIKLVRSVLKRRRSSPELDPLLSTSTSSRSHEPHSASFDLWLARISLCIEVVAYTAMPFATTGLAFTGLTMLSSFGSGFSPAVQSASMELYSRKLGGSVESGKLFGALSVIQALAGQILGPSIYGLIFIKTVAVFPTAIFFVSVGSVVISLICLSLVRLPADVRTDMEEEVSHIPDHGVRDATLVEVDESGDLRGRKNISPAVPVVTVSAPTP
ncbi:major facilitator superfamily domain-containing protein [Mycena alexandri]|uniref:Major facilitator superfamily domain-containing protein n=1 Tax=Mycena alexandri TaxID=1745969 RepID=A0AAD6TLC7_9AGAR|nr:major facilitator superfamily domain-containing protein [Mycena alexandri]